MTRSLSNPAPVCCPPRLAAPALECSFRSAVGGVLEGWRRRAPMEPRSLLWYHIEVDQGDEVRCPSPLTCPLFISSPMRCISRATRRSNFRISRVSLSPRKIGKKLKTHQVDPVKQRGPLALSELKALWAQGSIDRDTFVWCVAPPLHRRYRHTLPFCSPCVVPRPWRARATIETAATAVYRDTNSQIAV